jgi:DNA-binding MarR family transcriptional regulator
MLIDLPSFAVGGLVGAVVAVVAWAISRWWRERRTSSPVPHGNGVAVPVPSADGVAPHSYPPASGAPPNPGVRVSSDQIRLSERILIVLAREGRLGEDSPVRSVRTQAGLVGALGSSQSAVSKVLRRLVAAELLTEERRHVPGSSQRLKVYTLTRRGELLAREVARRRNVTLLPDRPGETTASSLPLNL